MSTGSMNLDCSGVTTENSVIYFFFLFQYGDSTVLVTLPAILFSIIVDLEWNFSRIAASINFPTGVTAPAVWHSELCSSNAVIVFVVIGGIVMLSRIRTGWGFALGLLAGFLACIVKYGQRMRLSVVSMITLLCLMNCYYKMGPVKFFITAICSAKLLSTKSNLSVVDAIGFRNQPLAT